VRIEDVFIDTFNILKDNFIVLFISFIILCFLSTISFGILAPFLLAGFIMMYKNAHEGKTITIDMIFAYKNKFLPLLGLVIVMLISIGIGTMLLIIPGLILSTMWLVAIPAMANEELSISEAIGASKKYINEIGFPRVFAIIIIMFILSMIIGFTFKTGNFIISFLFCFINIYVYGIIGVLYSKALQYET
jgi:hypothetical protein